MTDAISVKNKIQSLIPAYILDTATFIGTGILASSSFTLWINDSSTRSGVLLAGFMNATGLNIAYYLAKTDEAKYLPYKIIPTLITLAFTTFTTPYLAIALKDRCAVILTPQAALTIGLLNLAIKAVTYTLYKLGSRPTSLQEIKTTEEINNLSPEQKKLYYDFYNKKENQQLFSNRAEDIKDAFLKVFFTLPEVARLIHSRDQALIKEYTKLEASLLHAHLSTRQILPPPAEQISESYSQLFFKHDLKPLGLESPNSKHQIVKNLPIPSTSSEIAELTPNQTAWYNFLFNDLDVWKSLTLECQVAFNEKFFPKHGFKHLPTDGQSIQKASATTIFLLDKQVRSMDLSLASTTFLQATLARFNEIRYRLIVKIINQKIEEFTEDEIKQYHYLYSIYDQIPLDLPLKEIQIALSKKFINLKLYPPTAGWHCACELPLIDPEALAKLNSDEVANLPPVPIAEIEKLDLLQLTWISQFFSHDDETWLRIGFQSQIAFNNRFIYILGEIIPLTASPKVEHIPNISHSLATNLGLRYISDDFFNSEWVSYSYDIQTAFKERFEKAGVEIKVTSV